MRNMIALLFILAAPVHAAPFLTCNNYPPAEPQPSEFLVKMDAGPEISVPVVATGGGVAGVRLMHDVGQLGFGRHTVSVKAKSGTSVTAAATLSFNVGLSTPTLIIIP